MFDYNIVTVLACSSVAVFQIAHFCQYTSVLLLLNAIKLFF